MLTETDAALAFYRRIGHLGGIPYVAPFVRAARCLKGLTRDRARFDDGEFEEAGFLREAAENGLAQAVYHVLRLQACYLLDEPALALSYARKGERWLPYLRTIFFQADHFFYAALALSSLHDARVAGGAGRAPLGAARAPPTGSSSGPDTRPPRSATSRTSSRRRSRVSSGVPT